MAKGTTMKRKVWIESILVVLSIASILMWTQPGVRGQNLESKAEKNANAKMGTLSGTVTAPKEFKAARVYAKNVDKNVVYMVLEPGSKRRSLAHA